MNGVLESTARQAVAIVSASPRWNEVLEGCRKQSPNALTNASVSRDVDLATLDHRDTVNEFVRDGVGTVLLLCEGAALDDVTAPVRVIHDHINLSGSNPLIGWNELDSEHRFLDMGSAYDPALQDHLLTAAQAAGLNADRCTAVDAAAVPEGIEGPAVRIPGIAQLGIALHARAFRFAAVALMDEGTLGHTAGYESGGLLQFLGRAISVLPNTDTV